MSKLPLIIFIGLSLTLYSEGTPLNRVVGGENAYEGQFAYQVSLRRKGSHTCGGSIITQNYILTAAHCVGTSDSQGNYFTYSASEFTVRAGSTDRLRGGVLINVVQIITHEDYGNFLNDVALLKLEKPLIFSNNIQPIPLANSEVPVGEKVTISGWGRLKQGGDIPQKLQFNHLTAISREECKKQIKWDTDALICLAHEPNNGACNGDSGGPAVYEGKIVGIAGFVYTGCGTAYPDGFAKVYYHREWIKKNCDL